MRLLSVRIQDFRCIEDSTEFPITDVTCLVGKNESGKGESAEHGYGASILNRKLGTLVTECRLRSRR
jgi:predicted ATPase